MIISNPCKGICQFHVEKKVCIGCLRTRMEKLKWPSMTDDEKIDVLDLLDERREIYEDIMVQG